MLTTPAGPLHGLLDKTARRTPAAPALRTRDTQWTYAELAARSLSSARRLSGLGVGGGDRVVLLGRGGAESVATLFALSRLGAAFVVVSPTVKPYQLRHILADCAPALVLTDEEFRETLRLSDTEVPVHPIAAEEDGEPVAQGVPDARPAVSGTAVAALIYTSGSTAMPKAVVSTHAGMRFAVAAIQDRLALRADDVVGCFLPLSFDYGLYQVFLSCAAGATLALGSTADAGPGLLRQLREWDVTVLPAVPSMAEILLRMAGRTTAAPPPLRMVTNTGAHFPESYVEGFRRLFPAARIHLMFGLTECKRVSILDPDELADRPGSVGRPLPGTTCVVVDEDGRPQPPGVKGELVVTGPHVMAGYWRAPEMTARRFRTYQGRRALFTGDLCSLDEDGYLYFHGREDDVYKSRGFRVSALEIEAAALNVPGVDAAALVVTGSAGPVLAARTESAADEVMAALRARLDDYKLPTRVQVVGTLPLNGNGKVDKAALRTALESAR
ncbi:AMP-dependent ligase [Streptomyces parvus]|uniref:class I adenylate-forming enzyme family protein n=1 Tax=Streptomyces parvus TaxID=66428 RepID=UPI0019B7D96F|nr:class I adenylate-forming enzyme family protein [Streptomyces parvus]GGS49240.1 AMP-dependent ligase [Streptomyces parvus]